MQTNRLTRIVGISIVLGFMFSFLVACDEVQTKQPASNAQAVTTTDRQLPATQPAPARTEEVSPQHKVKDTSIDWFNKTFADHSDTNWIESVKGTDGGTALCGLRSHFGEMTSAMSLMDNGTKVGQLSWSDVKTNQDAATEQYRKVGLAYALELNRVLDIPYPGRYSMGSCGVGEGSVDMVNTGILTEYLVETLMAIKAKPSDIKTTAEKIRERLLKDYVNRIGTIRAGQQKKGDDDTISYLFREAHNSWNFTQQQLGVTNDELGRD